MRFYTTILILFVSILIISGCAGKKATPEEVLKEYEQMKSELDDDTVGESIEKLKAFQKRYAKYEISETVAEEVFRLQKEVKGRFHLAREMAREGDFERAEKILNDLTNYLANTSEGQMAKRFMQFEFHILKATRLMMDRRLEEAEQTIKEVMTKKLTVEQIEHAERMLDGISNARRGQAMAFVARMENACRVLQLLLHAYYAENGKYPDSLSLESLNIGDPSDQNRIKESLSAIEDYQTTDALFSLIAVGKDGKTRIRVTETGIKKQD